MKKDIKNEIVYRFLKESELSGISRLIESMKTETDQVLNLRNNSIEYYNWIYFKNPAGNAIIASAWHNDILVSTFAMAPKNIKIEGKEVLIGKTMDMFTDPDYQGLGIISKLTKMVFEESKRQGLLGWYVTPSENSYPIFKNKWNYKEPFELHFRYRIIDIRSMAKTIALSGFKKKIFQIGAFILKPLFSFKRNKNSKYSITELTTFTKEIDEFWKNVSDSYATLLCRNSAYLNWRYCSNPDNYNIYTAKHNNELKSFIVTKTTIRKGVKTGEIVDLLYDKNNSDAAISLIQHIQKELFESGCSICETWDFTNSSLSNLYERAGLKMTRGKVSFLLSPDSKIDSFYDKTKWHITQGDGNDI